MRARGFALVLSSTLAIPVAHAQTQAENVAAARALGVQGVGLADQGKCAEAIEKLERAQALYHAPSMLARLGECQVQVGQIVRGTENLNRVVREQLPPGSPKAYIDAQERARRVLEQALPRIAYLVLHVGPAGIQPSVTVAGVTIPSALIGAERPTDPGTHEVVASAPGYLPTKTSVTLAEGARQEITLTLTPDPSAAAAPEPLPPAPTTATPSTSVVAATPASPPRDKTLAYVLLGVGGAGLVTGGITGIMALSKKGDLECPEDRCPPSQHDTLDNANTLALVSTIGFGVGVAGAVAGTVLLLTGGSSDSSAQVGPIRARPFVTANGAGVFGSF
jgi:hypothetical protein